MNQPLAFLLRPKSVNDIIGQTHILGPNDMIIKMIEKKFCTSLIFYGPSGTGKTTFAVALAEDLNIAYDTFNATYDKKERLTKIVNRAIDEPNFILIIDEIHRMNKDKQDILLEYMEKGNIKLFATTTENPFFVINPAIRSRANIIELKRVEAGEMFKYVKKLIANKTIKLSINDEALNYLCNLASGDVRTLINSLEIFVKLYSEQNIDINLVLKAVPNAKNPSGAYGDDIHDLKSAFQKSVRGSDVDAALYYFARLYEIGDYETLMRRMLIIAYEDIGMANPTLPPRILMATNAFRQLGFPEGIIPLGLAVIEMALSEKSNSAYLAVKQAHSDIQNGLVYDMPDYLKDAHYKSAKKLNRGIGYKYAHDYPNDWVDQQYLPNEIKDIKYYKNKSHSSYEKKVYELYLKMKKN
ncbi:replication-associated recombination protein A [Mesoplasma syrphidae]|uniref:Replication-associated recombination protein A n=1 Tax=Mesoplasma syrphidae TaxID=225999 RepID=A0A2K9CD96_9MOLU|nr:replication-associated recombination protein A [Mesoplasma syrphidae]AUF83624.1 replication-associated recombination protein A [Mesoplasma syrphidae]